MAFGGASMKAQLSLEFAIYAAISAAAMVAVLALFLRAQAAQGAQAGHTYAEELVSLINANMAYSSSMFSAYLPTGLCNATVASDTLVTRFGSFALNGVLAISPNALCASAAGVVQLGMEELYNGTFALHR